MNLAFYTKYYKILAVKGLNYIERDITAHLQRVMKLFPVVTVCGPRQAGKTTLIRLICGLQEPTSGDFTLYGIRNDSKEIIKSRRRMGAVVETPSIYVDMTAGENLKQQ